mmetsp:Transcript_25948/g.71465  ORF Transcript_25948/g.71465 Transcript_25948/m.71465 type:complete len:121 (-) Transcript_25948:351-713(-)
MMWCGLIDGLIDHWLTIPAVGMLESTASIGIATGVGGGTGVVGCSEMEIVLGTKTRRASLGGRDRLLLEEALLEDDRDATEEPLPFRGDVRLVLLLLLLFDDEAEAVSSELFRDGLRRGL